MRDEPVLNRQISKLQSAKKRKKRIKRDALLYSVTSNDSFDVASYNKAWILKVSRGEVWFLSNIALPRGKYVYLGLNMKGTDGLFDTRGFHLVLVKWRSYSDNPSYQFRYQAKYINSKGALGKVTRKLDYDKQDALKTNNSARHDPRDHPRKSCRKAIYFHFQDNKYKGIITNLSRGGAFIETLDNLSFGQSIEIALPVKYSRAGIKLFGKVVRSEQNGVALSLKKVMNSRSGVKPRKFTSLEYSEEYRIPDLRGYHLGNKHNHFENSVQRDIFNPDYFKR